jgi:alpha-methylacyl-CoA racemase
MGPLHGIRILEIEAIGPVPWCGMMLSDMGADVLRIDRPVPARRLKQVPDRFQVANRGRRAITVDLKSPAGVATVLELATRADALVEGMRPGVMERLGLGPQACLAANPRLVYGRMTGWGQSGPLAHKAGHDINYIAMAGLLHGIGERDGKPVPPLNLIGDYGGGGMLLALGVCAALLSARATGRGQVVDTAMIDGVSSLMAPLFGQFAAGDWRDARGSNLLDGGAPWYGVYATTDGRYMAVGAVEPQFYAALLQTIGLDPALMPAREDRANWPLLQAAIAERFGAHSQAQWIEAFADVDACVTPVLTLAEALQHRHQAARSGFVEIDGVRQPAPAPRFSATPSGIDRPPCGRGADGTTVPDDWR